MEVKAVSLETKRTNEVTEILGDFKNINLKVDYFWDNHGKLINWNDSVEEPTSWSKVDVKIRKYSFTEKMLDNEYDFETLQLWVNNKLIAGDVIDCKVKLVGETVKALYCKVTVGWG